MTRHIPDGLALPRNHGVRAFPSKHLRLYQYAIAGLQIRNRLLKPDARNIEQDGAFGAAKNGEPADQPLSQSSARGNRS
jgi:hypothetical protein